MHTPIVVLLMALAQPAPAVAQHAYSHPDFGQSFNNAGSTFLDNMLRQQANQQQLQGLARSGGAAPRILATPVQAKDEPPHPPQQRVSDDPSFRLTNRGSLTIQEIYVSSVRTDDWGEDRLGADVLEPGQSVIIRLPRGDCLNDIRIVFDDDSAQERRQVDTCAVTDLDFP